MAMQAAEKNIMEMMSDLKNHSGISANEYHHGTSGYYFRF